jgi:uncharacterized protein (TIGR03083 family)
MQLDRSETIQGTLREYEAFADLLDTISPAAWHQATRCAGWEVRDVAGHVVATVDDVLAGVPGSRTPDEEAAALRDLSPAEMATRLRSATEQLGGLTTALDNDEAWGSPSGFNDLTMAEGILTLWYDTWMHADDIRSAVGLPHDDGAGLRATLSYLEDELTRQSWGPAAFVFTDRDESFGALAVGEAGASTPTHRVPAYELTLAATGRLDPTTLGLEPDINLYAEG